MKYLYPALATWNKFNSIDSRLVLRRLSGHTRLFELFSTAWETFKKCNSESLLSVLYGSRQNFLDNDWQ